MGPAYHSREWQIFRSISINSATTLLSTLHINHISIDMCDAYEHEEDKRRFCFFVDLLGRLILCIETV